jgi:uncharacterized protein (DUF433 family)
LRLLSFCSKLGNNALRLMPDTGEAAMTTFQAREQVVDIGQLIVASPDIRRGRPRIAGTGVTVQRIVTLYKLGLSPEEIAGEFGHLTLAQVYAGLAYYHANQEQLEAVIEADQAASEQLELLSAWG